MNVEQQLDTSTYDFDIQVLTEFGAAAQAVKSHDASLFSRGSLHNSGVIFSDTVSWLLDHQEFLENFRKIALDSASTRTHPRHIMDASRYIGVENHSLLPEISALTQCMMAGESFRMSEETAALAQRALGVIENDRALSEAGIKEWAEKLAIDCTGRND